MIPDDIRAALDSILKERWAKTKKQYEDWLDDAFVNLQALEEDHIFPKLVKVHNWLHPNNLFILPTADPSLWELKRDEEDA